MENQNAENTVETSIDQHFEAWYDFVDALVDICKHPQNYVEERFSFSTCEGRISIRYSQLLKGKSETYKKSLSVIRRNRICKSQIFGVENRMG